MFIGLSAMLAESCTYPIDTAKTRLQLQGQHLEKRWQLIRYKGMTNCLVTIVKEEGVKAMYQGLSSALVRQEEWISEFLGNFGLEG